MASSGNGSGNNSDNGLGGAIGIGVGATVLVLGAAAFAFGRRSVSAAAATARNPATRDLQGLTICITGGNVGIGRAVAFALSQRGAKILMGCRNIEQGKQVCETIGHDQCRVYPLDLASYDSVEAFSRSIANDSWIGNNTANNTSRGLNALINNAGAMIKEEEKTITIHHSGNEGQDSGWDRSMVVNHLGWVQLTQNLLPLLENAAKNNQSTTTNNQHSVRIINVGSKLEKRAVLPDNVDDPGEWDQWMKSSPTHYNPFAAYSRAKFAMTAATFHWAKLLEEDNATLSSGRDNNTTPTVQMVLVSPGMVNTSLPRFMPLWKRVLSFPIRALLLKTPEQGAESVLFATTAASPAVQSGRYYSDCQEIQDTSACSDAAKSPVVGQHIWEATWRALEKRKMEASTTTINSNSNQ